MNDEIAVYCSAASDPRRAIFIIVTHGTVFSYFVETDCFSRLPDDDSREWIENPSANQWWMRIA